MCLFEYDEKKAMAAQREEGREEERVRLLVKFVKNGILTIEQAANEAGITVEEFEKILEKN